jgi:hypothetical protein
MAPHTKQSRPKTRAKTGTTSRRPARSQERVRAMAFRSRRRRTPSEKVLSAVSGALSSGPAKKAKPGKKPLGGLALAGIAGLVFKNRDKLPSRTRRPEPVEGPAATF